MLETFENELNVHLRRVGELTRVCTVNCHPILEHGLMLTEETWLTENQNNSN